MVWHQSVVPGRGATLRVMDSGHELLNVLEEMWAEASRFLIG